MLCVSTKTKNEKSNFRQQQKKEQFIQQRTPYQTKKILTEVLWGKATGTLRVLIISNFRAQKIKL